MKNKDKKTPKLNANDYILSSDAEAILYGLILVLISLIGFLNYGVVGEALTYIFSYLFGVFYIFTYLLLIFFGLYLMITLAHRKKKPSCATLRITSILCVQNTIRCICCEMKDKSICIRSMAANALNRTIFSIYAKTVRIRLNNLLYLLSRKVHTWLIPTNGRKIFCLN